MKSMLRGWRRWLAVGLLTSTAALDTRAATLHVWQESTAPTPPYDSWLTAARTIQDAVDTAVGGDIVLVTNGVYEVGGRAVTGIMTNRVVIQKAITVRSVNGPVVSIIKGAAAPGGSVGHGAIRCVYLGAGAKLDGLTLTEGHTLGSGGDETVGGGGVFCETNAILTNCVFTNNAAVQGGGVLGGSLYSCRIVGNWAWTWGGGVFGGSLYSCRIVGNRGNEGGGAFNSTLVNCELIGNVAIAGGGVRGRLNYVDVTRYDGSYLRNCVLAGNRSAWGGGASWGTVLYNCTITGNTADTRGGGVDADVLCYNCVVFHNQAPAEADYATNGYGGLSYCCTQPLPAGEGNINQEPKLASATHLRPGSPCVGFGSENYASGVDIDGQSWAVPPCIGADQVVAGSPAGPLSVLIKPAFQTDYPQVLPGTVLQLEGRIEGQSTGNEWDFGDGTIVTNQEYEPFVTHAWSVPGSYQVKLTAFNSDHLAGVASTSIVEVVDGQYYVNAANASPVAPYNTWATAAQTIGDAISAALPGGLVTVTNGVYDQEEPRPPWSALVAIDKSLTVQSVNGPLATVIDGGSGGMRCASVGSGAVLSGFTLTGGWAPPGSAGGGASCSSNGIVTNCIVVRNFAFGTGGGIYGGNIFNCRIEQNRAFDGGGVSGSSVFNSELVNNTASNNGGGANNSRVSNSVLAYNTAGKQGGGTVSCTLSNCTVVGNQAGVSAGGAYLGALYNTIAYYNSSPTNSNHSGLEDCRYSCTSPLPAGEGNISEEPALASARSLSSGSPCIGTGSSAYAAGVDIDGEPWATPPSIGADQVVPGSVTGPISVAILADRTRFGDGFVATFQARIDGRASRHVWDFGDGSTATNAPDATHAWSSGGTYEVRLTAFNDGTPAGVTVSVIVEVVSAPVFYVNLASTNPVFPYVTWATAATNIQQASDASVPGRRIVVTNGVYELGMRAVDGITNRVAVDLAVRLESVNGPAVTVIRGAPGMRGVYLGNNAVLSGFTVSDGAIDRDYAYGCGIWAAPDAVVTNCWIEGNQTIPFDRTVGFGGGVSGGTLYRCRLSNNSAYSGGGAYGSVLYDCMLTNNSVYGAPSGGGAATDCTLYRCTLVSNRASGPVDSYGGGAVGGKLYNCLLKSNSAIFGGGAANAELYHCTVVGNSVGGGRFGSLGAGTYRCTNWNTIIYYNSPPESPQYANDVQSTFNFSCTTPLPTNGLGNIDTEPGFVDRLAGDFRLLPGSPCIDTGTNLLSLVTADLDGTPRPLDGNGDGTAAFDMGAYEHLLPTADSNGDGIPDGWTWQHGLNPTDLNVAMLDPDLDGSLTGQEWIADTDPTNAASLVRISTVLPGPPVAVTFLSSSNRFYRLETRADLAAAAWTTVAGQTAIAGNGNLLSLVDTNSSTAAYYRVGVRLP